MGVFKGVDFRITGQVNADMCNTYEIVEAELKLICAKYQLELEDESRWELK